MLELKTLGHTCFIDSSTYLAAYFDYKEGWYRVYVEIGSHRITSASFNHGVDADVFLSSLRGSLIRAAEEGATEGREVWLWEMEKKAQEEVAEFEKGYMARREKGKEAEEG